MESAAIYAEVPLPPIESHLEGSIRLLRLDPTEDRQSPLSGSLSSARLTLRTRYEALSYCWGPPFEGQVLEEGEISINGWPLAITGNLDHALRRLRHSMTPRVLWVDAICIDQSNDKEKSQQVRLMAHIYRMAFQIAVWLGEESKELDGELVLGLDAALREWCPWTPTGWSCDARTRLDNAELARTAKAANKSQWEHRRDLLNITSDVREKCFSAFKRRRYFRRRWVMQEMCQARRLIVYCGNSRAAWTTVHKSLERGHRGGHDAMAKFFGLVKELTSAVRGRAHINSYTDAVSWFRILSECWQLDCSNEHDKIYGLVSFMQGCNFGFRVDYTVTWPQMYMNFTRYCIQHGLEYSQSSSADVWGIVLGIAGFQAALRDVAGTQDELVPSWAPDWRLKSEHVAINGGSSAAFITQITTRRAVIRHRSLSACLGLYGTISQADDTQSWGDSLVLVEPNGIKITSREPGFPPDHNKHFCPSLTPGDHLCSPVMLLRDLTTPIKAIEDVLALVLRPMDGEQSSFRLVGLCSLFRFKKVQMGQLKPRTEIMVDIG